MFLFWWVDVRWGDFISPAIPMVWYRWSTAEYILLYCSRRTGEKKLDKTNLRLHGYVQHCCSSTVTAWLRDNANRCPSYDVIIMQGDVLRTAHGPGATWFLPVLLLLVAHAALLCFALVLVDSINSRLLLVTVSPRAPNVVPISWSNRWVVVASVSSSICIIRWCICYVIYTPE